MNKHYHTVLGQEEQLRIDQLLVRKNKSHSRTQIQSWIQEGYVTVNDQNIKPNYKCRIGDKISWSIPEQQPLVIMPEQIPLDIIYEDKYLLVVHKPRQMVVHPTRAHQSGTLVNALLAYTDQLSTIGGKERPGIIHRLDRNTCGLLVVAKDNYTHQHISEQFKNGSVQRTYEAIVHGQMKRSKGTIQAPIARDPYKRTKMAVVSGGKKAITHYQVIKRFVNYTYVKCRLQTGRTHQIRVHMNYIGHSIVGDPVYIDQKTLQIGGQALIARKLQFIHPHKNECVHFAIDIPDFFQKTLDYIGAEET